GRVFFLSWKVSAPNRALPRGEGRKPLADATRLFVADAPSLFHFIYGLIGLSACRFNDSWRRRDAFRAPRQSLLSGGWPERPSNPFERTSAIKRWTQRGERFLGYERGGHAILIARAPTLNASTAFEWLAEKSAILMFSIDSSE
ncbi:hypothetical protein TcCL_ESM11802, partial [Trypanosoma cruzi]